MIDHLLKVPLLAGLPEEGLRHLSEHLVETWLEKDGLLFEEGDPGDACYVITGGALAVTKRSGNQDVLLAVRGPGEVLGEMALIDDAPRSATVRAREASALLRIDKQDFHHLLATTPGVAFSMLQTFSHRLRETRSMLHHSEKMAALGTMTAGIAHELNNPAAAARRASEQLADALEQLERANLELETLGLDEAERDSLRSLHDALLARSETPTVLDTLARSDLESEVETALEARGVEQAWEVAPQLVSASTTAASLDEMAGQFAAAHLPAALRWLAATSASHSLLSEIRHSTRRLTDIVGAMKEYAYLDQAPVQDVDIHQSLDNTLIMLGHKLRDVVVKREYAPDLPHITAYGSELSQVWTNLIDNAVDAMNRQGNLTIRTRPGDQEVVVEVSDDGPGIPEAIRERVFEPFFTTKGPGKGTGLGLHISRNIVIKHGGQISAASRPGATTFEVRLPLEIKSN